MLLNCRTSFPKSLHILIALIPFILNASGAAHGDEEIYAKLSNGNVVLGLEQTALHSGKVFWEFRGIPYAVPPVDTLRFKPSVEYSTRWEEPRLATTYGSACPQDDVLNEEEEEGHIEDIVKPMGSEDCLFLNVATPAQSLTNRTSLPVIVWIHGGSFLYESGDAYGPRKFMEHDVVYVTFNYRVGVLGFFNMGDGQIHGNMGLKDQVLALKWVQENIFSFGGDPDSVTLMGVNSGAASAHLHMLSPMSKDLFHRVILQSGTGISPWVLQQNPKKISDRFLYDLDCPVNTNGTMSDYDCMMKVDAEILIRKQSHLTEWFIDPLSPVGPSIENHASDDPKFLTEDPYTILSSGNFWAKDKVSMIIGVNSHEGLMHSWDIAHHIGLARTLNMEWGKAIPITLNFRDTAVSWKKVSDGIFYHYFQNNEDGEGNVQPSSPKDAARGLGGKKDKKAIGKDFYKFEELTQMYSDRYFFIPVHKAALLHAQFNKGTKSPVFLYWFDFKGSQSFTQFSGYNSTIVGAAHFDQIQYMFDNPYFQELTKPEEIEFSRKFVAGIVRFVVEGEPPAWGWDRVTKVMTEGSVPFIYNRIGSPKDSFQLIEPFYKSIEFWDTLPLLEYGKTKYDFPELLKESSDEEDGDDDDDDPEVVPGVRKSDIEKLKSKLEL